MKAIKNISCSTCVTLDLLFGVAGRGAEDRGEIGYNV